ncbi:uncharacterized protein TRAVEDRAFT_71093 [Trametes versicolor FP-101664 SS1]|uniref:uncharacterized protein n=1 Tax=Trametes versicolor (strain FP-101664) TaxID=717944 RepID=UPI00046213AE|nr:uncharacterized protein TRAVEDRAFT_71093 [Trametes versicolor FP-101664 SS1]EIW60815.1 hypothetical protein TRAVEDRAFT_71093 [Trametes versicolor FP-101664 SS1]
MDSFATTASAQPTSLASLSHLVESTFGAYLFGTSASLILYGISLCQFRRYLCLYPTDASYIRAIVFAVMVLESVHTPMLMHTCYYFLVSNYANPQTFNSPPWSLKIAPTLAAVITFTAQVNNVGSITAYNRSNEWLFSAPILPASVADGLLTSAIIIGLRRSRETSTRAHSVYELFMLYVVNSGLFTTLVSIVPYVVGVVMPKTFIWAAVSFVPTRLYAMTLLCVLNSRKRLAGRGLEIFGKDVPMRSIIARANHLAAVEQWNAPALPDRAPTKIAISISAETESDVPDTALIQKCHSEDHLTESMKTRGVARGDSS